MEHDFRLIRRILQVWSIACMVLIIALLALGQTTGILLVYLLWQGFSFLALFYLLWVRKKIKHRS